MAFEEGGGGQSRLARLKAQRRGTFHTLAAEGNDQNGVHAVTEVATVQ